MFSTKKCFTTFIVLLFGLLLFSNAVSHSPAPRVIKDKQKLLDLVEKEGVYSLNYASNELKKDKEFFLSIIDKYGADPYSASVLRFASDDLKKDKDVVLFAINKNADALCHADPKFKDDMRIVEKAMVSSSASAYRCLSDRLKNDKAYFISKVVDQYPNGVIYAGDDIKNDRNIVLPLLNKDCHLFPSLGDSIKDDRSILIGVFAKCTGLLNDSRLSSYNNDTEVITAVIKSDCEILEYADSRQKKNRPIAFKDTINKCTKSFIRHQEILKNHKDLILAVFQRKGMGHLLQYISDKLKFDQDIAFAAVKSDSKALKFIDDALKSDREFILRTAKLTSSACDYAHPKLRKDKSFILDVLALQKGSALSCTDESLRNDREFVMKLIKQQSFFSLTNIGGSLKNDREITLIAVKNNGRELSNANKLFKKDKDVVLAAVENYRHALQYAKTFRNDKEVILKAIANNGTALQYASVALKRDKEIVLAAVRSNGLALRYADDNLKKDKEVVIAAIKNNGYSIKYAHQKLKQDRSIVEMAVTNNGRAISFVTEKYRKDKNLNLTAIKNDRNAILLIDESLRKDKEFMLSVIKTAGDNMVLFSDKTLIKELVLELGIKIKESYLKEIDKAIRIPSIYPNASGYTGFSESMKKILPAGSYINDE